MALKDKARRALSHLPELIAEPTITVDLMHGATDGNDPFYARIVREFWKDSRSAKRSLPLVGQFTWGVALARLPDRYDDFVKTVDGSARRNCKKADRAGYKFARIDFNAHRADIAEIRGSSETRQGKMPDELVRGEVREVTDPASKTNVHDYPWFGVLKGDKLVAYASCFVAGEVCLVNHVFGHAAHQNDGVVPRLFLGIAEYVYATYPHVYWFGYDTWFGASETLRRFKQKLGFGPYHVRWILDGKRTADHPHRGASADRPVEKATDVPAAGAFQLVYRRRAAAPMFVEAVQGATFHYFDNAAPLALVLPAARGRFPGVALAKAAAKLATKSRQYYCVIIGTELVSDGWVTLGRCRHYPIADDEVVIGPTWTSPAHRGKGLATFALGNAVNALFARGFAVSYIDTSTDNIGMQKVIARTQYGPPARVLPRDATSH